MTEPLASWNDTAPRCAIVGFVQAAVSEVPPEERIAVFDNGGTLWCEKPMPIELAFIFRRLATRVEGDASLREQQPVLVPPPAESWTAKLVRKAYVS